MTSTIYNSISSSIQWGYQQVDRVRDRASHVFDGTKSLLLRIHNYLKTDNGRRLDLSSRGLEQFPYTELPQLERLDLRGNRLTRPPVLKYYPHLLIVDLSANLLRKAPYTRQNPKLKYLHLRRNFFDTAPDTKDNPDLEKIDLSHNSLRETPIFRHNPRLRNVNLDHCYLTRTPNFKKNPELEFVELCRNRFDRSPNFQYNPKLQVLDLSANLLTIPPDTTRNPELLYLRLTRNYLIVPPIVSENPKLQRLKLDTNRLTQPPDLTHNRNLTHVDLSFNDLIQSPDFTNNRNLQSVELQNNRLTSLHDSILRLPSTCRVNAENNHFTVEYIVEFLGRLDAHRAAHPGEGPSMLISVYEPEAAPTTTLQEEVQFWCGEFQREFPQREVLPCDPFGSALNPDEQDLMRRYLGELHRIEDYAQRNLPANGKNPEAKKNVIRRINNLLELASQNKEFRQEMLDCIQNGTGTCRDRPLVVFNDLEILHQLYQEKEEDAFHDLCIRAERYDIIKQKAVKLNTADEVEAILALHLALKAECNLPISTTYMGYDHFGNRLTANHVQRVREEMERLDSRELLESSRHLAMRNHRRYPEEAARIDEEYMEKVAAIQEEHAGLHAVQLKHLTEEVDQWRIRQLTALSLRRHSRDVMATHPE